jgi:hypothetical protein
MVLLLWLVAGAGLLGYCLLSTNNPNIATLLQVNALVTVLTRKCNTVKLPPFILIWDLSHSYLAHQIFHMKYVKTKNN